MPAITFAERLTRADLDVRQLQCLVAIYEERSIAAAARRLNVVPAAVSMQLRRLEQAFGVRLFERGPHGVVPVAIANEIYPRCCAVLRELDAIGDALRGASGSVTLGLRIGVTPSVAHGVLGAVLAKYNEQRPDVEVYCHEGYSEGLIELLGAGTLDVAIVTMDVNAGALAQEPVSSEPLMVMGRAASGAIAGPRFAARDLAGRTLVLPPRSNYLRTLIERGLQTAGIVPAHVLEMASLATVFGVLRESDALAILPSVVIGEGRLPNDLVAAMLVEPEIRRSLVAAWPNAKPPTIAATEFIALLRDALSSFTASTGTNTVRVRRAFQKGNRYRR